MPLCDPNFLSTLLGEFRRSMQRLIGDLCDDLEQNYSESVVQLGLPVEFFRLLGHSLTLEDYSGWKVVGWIEALNDLVYFVDLEDQWEREPDRASFAEQLHAECEEKFYENSYLDELFPAGKPDARGLRRRLTTLCERLAREITQESLLLVPGLPSAWCRMTARTMWEVRGSLAQDVERGEQAGTLAVGTVGDWYEAPAPVQKALKSADYRVTFAINRRGMALRVGRMLISVQTVVGNHPTWNGALHRATVAARTTAGPLSVGPSLVYGRQRQPRTVVPTQPALVERIQRAWDTIREAWPEGHEVLALLTSRIIPLKAKGVVSFSYRHRPGLSFINCFERDNLDLIDDLIHENSHHHLNLLLRKQVLYRGDRNREIFYSPWRRSLRPIRGILHAAFTFTMGAMLFERLSSWGAGKQGLVRWTRAGLTRRDLLRARFRCLEEVESVRYSIQDLEYADRHLGWLTGSGRRLVGQLAEAITKVERNMARHRKEIERSKFGPPLRRHVEELKKARQTYGPVRLGKV